jgi:hypothetical protein
MYESFKTSDRNLYVVIENFNVGVNDVIIDFRIHFYKENAKCMIYIINLFNLEYIYIYIYNE